MPRIYVNLSTPALSKLMSQAETKGMSPAALAANYLEKDLMPNTRTVASLVDEAVANANKFVSSVISGRLENVPKTAQEFLKKPLIDVDIKGHHNGKTLQFGLQFKQRIDSGIVQNLVTYWRDEESKIPYVNGSTGGRLYIVDKKDISSGDFYIK
ncbi:hypothetical protein [Levilactobacillus namurensis]|uniref:Uncharacterized protein n=1 Tax=Levilactobacillus namurensis TaxID=380393 RepID=A0AAW8W3J9_9LACO|nr:hypothetical protein [Levilactobacillus namurensis]MDT7013312.1 hypothetical protein [Levilactobacillus namurensis]